MTTVVFRRRRVSLILVLLLLSCAGVTAANGQGAAAADLPARMTGRWKLNEALSPGLSAPPARGRAGGARGAAGFVVAAVAFQRGGRGGGGGGAAGGGGADSPIMSAEVAAQAALAVIQQVPMEVTIAASGDAVEFNEPRGQSLFKVDGKNASVDVPGGSIKVKTRWDRGSLRQEFSSAQRTLKRAWSLDEHDRLVLTQHIESVTLTTKEARAVFDRQ